MATQDVAARFTSDTANHEMTVLHDDGLYRHLRFRNPNHGMHWFDLITVPGALTFQGDGESYMFRRIEDMFEFFRGPIGRINPDYWAEKLTSGRGQVLRYDEDLLRQHIDELVAEAIQKDAKAAAESGTPPKLADLAAAITNRVTDELYGDESLDRAVVERFTYWADPTDEFAVPRKNPDFQFIDVWEWPIQDYHWWFQWACHAIVWGIAQYDKAKANFPANDQQAAVVTP